MNRGQDGFATSDNTVLPSNRSAFAIATIDEFIAKLAINGYAIIHTETACGVLDRQIVFSRKQVGRSFVKGCIYGALVASVVLLSVFLK